MNLGADEIHLWLIYDELIVAKKLLCDYMALLNQEEQKQQSKFYFAKHRHQYLITRASLRILLSLYNKNILPQDWQFYKNTNGKPYVANNDLTMPIFFNLSHTEKLVVIAITKKPEIGVDVEYLTRDTKILEFVDKIFLPSEVAYLKSLPIEKQKKHFFLLWTLKEAYIKTLGTTLALPLQQFSYSPDTDSPAIFYQKSTSLQDLVWRFWCIELENHHLALATNRLYKIKSPTIVIRNFNNADNSESINYAIRSLPVHFVNT